MIVVDASALVDLLLRRRPASERIRAEIASHESLHSPHLIDTETLHALRRWVMRGDLAAKRAERALDALAAMPMIRYPHQPLSPAIWSLRARLSAYDATYAALARSLGATLLTSDTRLARGVAGFVAVVDVSGESAL